MIGEDPRSGSSSSSARHCKRFLDNHWLLAVPLAFVALVSATSVTLVSVVFVVLVRKDAHDHALRTGVVVTHPVVTDRHHRHSMELVFVEAEVIEIVVVIAHTIHFQLLLFLSHQQVEELGAIPVVVKVNLAVQNVQEAPEVCQEDQEEHRDGELVSSPPSFSGLTSRIFLPEHNHCPHTRVKTGAEKVEFELQEKPSRHLVLNGFSRGAPRQWIHRWPQRCQNCHRGCLEATYSTGNAYSARNDVEGLPYAEKNPLQLQMNSREGVNCFPEPKDLHLLVALWTSAVRFSSKLPRQKKGRSSSSA